MLVQQISGDGDEGDPGPTMHYKLEKVRPWCGQPSDRGRLKNRTEYRVK